jgi:hypothetical protein
MTALKSDFRFSPDCVAKLLLMRIANVDGSELARAFSLFAALVGAAMCSAF